jgi:apolipoprotein N-acyltransferase
MFIMMLGILLTLGKCITGTWWNGKHHLEELSFAWVTSVTPASDAAALAHYPALGSLPSQAKRKLL